MERILKLWSSLLQSNVWDLCRNMWMFPIWNMEWNYFFQYISMIYFRRFLLIYIYLVNQESWKLGKLWCIYNEIQCFFVFKHIFSWKIYCKHWNWGILNWYSEFSVCSFLPWALWSGTLEVLKKTYTFSLGIPRLFYWQNCYIACMCHV